MAHDHAMATSARFKFTATLLVSVLAVLLTLFVPGDENDAADSPMRTASVLPPPQR